MKSDLVLSTDPDADRIGVFARDGAGRWRYLNGNEIASVLAYYLVADRERGPRRSGLLIKTLVTTRTLPEDCRAGELSDRRRLACGFQIHRPCARIARA